MKKIFVLYLILKVAALLLAAFIAGAHFAPFRFSASPRSHHVLYPQSAYDISSDAEGYQEGVVYVFPDGSACYQTSIRGLRILAETEKDLRVLLEDLN